MPNQFNNVRACKRADYITIGKVKPRKHYINLIIHSLILIDYYNRHQIN